MPEKSINQVVQEFQEKLALIGLFYMVEWLTWGKMIHDVVKKLPPPPKDQGQLR
jgi:hypothetical protein